MDKIDKNEPNCYVTMYLDINRHVWKSYSRTFDEYFITFSHVITLFSKQEKDELFIFIDSKYYDKMIDETKHCNKIKCISIDFKWMENLHCWNQLEREKIIMNSDEFKKVIPKYRISCPETYCPEYTIVTHCKIDAVNYVIDNNMSTSKYYTWIDFGLFKNQTQHSQNLPDISKLPKDKILFTTINAIVPCNIHKNIQEANEFIAGYFFFGEKSLMKEYQKLYHRILQYYFQDNNLADDDQAITLYSYLENPNLFRLDCLNQWHIAFKTYE